MNGSTRRFDAESLLLALSLLIGALFVYIVASHALTDGLCCGDDAAIALAAKSLAEGEGYSLPLNFIGESGRFTLHHGLSTGPTLVLPAAALIAIAGPQLWGPSMVSATLSLALLLVTTLLVGRATGVRQGVRFALVLLLSLYALTSGGGLFVQWYSLLGEMPALLLLALAAWLSSAMRGDGAVGSANAFMAGVAAGLAVNSKLLALIGALAVGGLYAFHLVRGGGLRAFRDGVVYTLGMLLPPVAFELFRWGTLGTEGYVQWLYSMRDFFGNQAPGASSGGFESGTFGRAKYNLATLFDATRLTWLLALLPLLSAATWLLHDRQYARLMRASMICCVVGLTYAAWWLLYSNGWPRYALIGMGVLTIAAAFGAASLRRPAALALGTAVVLVVVPWTGLAQLQAPVGYAWRNGFIENERLTALRQVDRYLDEGQGRGSVVAGSWWASLVAVEYVSDNPRRTVGFNRLYTAKPDLPDTLLLVSPQWDDMAGANRDPVFQQFARICTTSVLSAPPFELRRCDMVVQ